MFRSTKDYKKKMNEEDKKRDERQVKELIEEEKDNEEWEKKEGIENTKIKNQTISKNPEYCENKIKNVCWNVYEKKLRKDGYCVTRNCKRCKEELMKAKKCKPKPKKKLVEYPPLRF